MHAISFVYNNTLFLIIEGQQQRQIK